RGVCFKPGEEDLPLAPLLTIGAEQRSGRLSHTLAIFDKSAPVTDDNSSFFHIQAHLAPGLFRPFVRVCAAAVRRSIRARGEKSIGRRTGRTSPSCSLFLQHRGQLADELCNRGGSKTPAAHARPPRMAFPHGVTIVRLFGLPRLWFRPDDLPWQDALAVVPA